MIGNSFLRLLGRMLNGGRLYLNTAWWLTAFPGFAIFVTVLAVNLLGDHLTTLGSTPRPRNDRRGNFIAVAGRGAAEGEPSGYNHPPWPGSTARSRW
jgi:hypothetical protein